METLNITMKEARYCLGLNEYAENMANRYNQKQLQDRVNWDTDIKNINGKFYYVKMSDGVEYKYLLENYTTKMYIDNNEVSKAYLEGILGDLSEMEQHDVLKNFYLGGIEKYLSKRCGTQITLNKLVTMKNGKYVMDLYTDDLVDKSGVCKAMLEHLYIESRGNGFYIDQETGKQIISFSTFRFVYQHVGGGSNGHEMGCIRMNEKEELLGWNYETEKYEVI